MSKKIGLALGSGGSRGVCHIGVIKALEEEGIRPDYITGCSMGAVVGACYASGMSTDEMLKATDKIKTLKLVDLSVVPITRLALLRGNKMRRLIDSCLKDVTFDQLQIPFACVATDLYSGKTQLLNSGSVAQAVCASSSIPTVFPPVKIDNKLLVDGGVLCRVPVMQAKDMGADVVIAVDALLNTKEPVKRVKNIVALVTRTFDILDNHNTRLRKKVEGMQNQIWIEPEMEGLNQYEVKNFRKAYACGYEAAKAAMPQIKELINE